MAENTNSARLDYGNWVPWKLLAALFAAALVLFVLSLFLLYLVIGAVVFVVILMVFAYERYMFSPRGGNVQAKLRDLLVSHLDWDGNGHIIDIGCGSGPVTIRVAKKYPRAEVLGLDYWGKAWEYSKAKCEQNAKIENVQDRVSFQKGDAAKLPFEDGFFDAAVSNLAFHEVGSAKDKRDVLKEALRVVRKGGKFAFQDLFTMKRHYHTEINDLLDLIRSWGVESVNFEKTMEARIAPRPLRETASIIWGTK
ncbi:MAG TPA: class I SAM-dependent methyltransferase [Nitrososphaerales archaeon]|nr:class I SAM-dependent methyltransferase [Nitrososphaerales archaeon]